MQALTNAQIGKTYTISWLLGTPQIEEIFNNIGFTVGMPIKLIQNLNGSVLVRYGKRVYGMSSEVASRIKVN